MSKAGYAAGESGYRICTRCVMDTTGDPDIRFDEAGVCHYCRRYDQVIAQYVRPGEQGRRELAEICDRIRKEGRGKPYDCVIGLSGGVDSTYVAYLVKEYGLRPLAVHLDNGWNTEIAVGNIEKTVRALGIDLVTEVLDWEEFRDLQLAFLRSGTPDLEIPTDHAINTILYRTAIKHGVRFIINGSNFATEQMIPPTWSRGHADWKYIRSIHKAFGTRTLKTYPHYTHFDLWYRFPKIKRLESILILNYVDYDKFAAIEVMKDRLGWVSYGGKHHESVYTRFYQGFILPRKFHADKRRPHLSCLINNGKISRDQALAELQKPPLDETVMETDRVFVAKKLGISLDEFDKLMAETPKSFWDYDSYDKNPPAYHAVIQQAYVHASHVKSFLRAVPRAMVSRFRRLIIKLVRG